MGVAFADTASRAQALSAATGASDRWVFRAYLALLVALPLPLGGNHAWAWALTGGWICVLALAWIGLWVAGRVVVGAALYRARGVVGLLALFVVWSLVQLTPLPGTWLAVITPTAWLQVGPELSSIAVDAYRGSEKLLQSITLLCLFCLGLLLIRHQGRVRAVLIALVIGGVFQAAYGGLMTLSGLEYGFFVKKADYLGVATGTFVNRNHLAGYLEMTLAAGLGLMLGSGAGHHRAGFRAQLNAILGAVLGGKLLLRIGLVVMVIGLVLTHSRMGNSAFMISLLTGGVVWLIAVKGVSRTQAAVFLISVLAVDLLIIGSWFGFEQVVERLSHTSLQQESRDDALRYAAAYLRDYWLTGSGGGSFYTVFPGYGRAFIGYYDQAHNDYVQFVAEYGVIGTVLLGAAVIWTLGGALYAVLGRRDRLLKGAAWSAFVGMFALLFHGWADFNLQIPANAATFVSLMALAWVSLVVGRADGRAL